MYKRQLLFILVYKTPFGLRMKACGLDAHAAESVGIKVNRVRMIAALLSCFLAALGGAYLSMGYMSFYSSNMVASRGWIGIAAAAVGGNNLGVVVFVTMIFSVAQAIVNVDVYKRQRYYCVIFTDFEIMIHDFVIAFSR